MVQSASKIDVIEKEVRIDARPDLVYEYLTDAQRLVKWASPDVIADSRPGGVFRLNFNGFDIMRGEFVELIPAKRVVFTWGWESLGDQTPPGESTVEIDLTPDGDGTRLTLVHRGLRAIDLESNSQGWDYCLDMLAKGIHGEQGNTFSLSEAEAKASQLNTTLIELRYAVESASDAAWRSTTKAEGWAVAATSRHAAGHAEGVLALDMVFQNRGDEFAALAPTDEGNNARARELRDVARDDVLAVVRETGPKAVEFARGLSDADLARTCAFGSAELSVRELLAGLVDTMIEHVDSVKATIGR